METRVDNALYNAVDVMRASARMTVMLDRNRNDGTEDSEQRGDLGQNREYCCLVCILH